MPIRAFIHGWTLQETLNITSGFWKVWGVTAPFSCPKLNPLFWKPVPKTLWSIASLLQKLTTCPVIAPATWGEYWQPSWSIRTGAAGGVKVFPSRPFLT